MQEFCISMWTVRSFWKNCTHLRRFIYRPMTLQNIFVRHCIFTIFVYSINHPSCCCIFTSSCDVILFALNGLMQLYNSYAKIQKSQILIMNMDTIFSGNLERYIFCLLFTDKIHLLLSILGNWPHDNITW